MTAVTHATANRDQNIPRVRSTCHNMAVPHRSNPKILIDLGLAPETPQATPKKLLAILRCFLAQTNYEIEFNGKPGYGETKCAT
ncbi:MAG TPA: hypothetical protein VG028_20375 [Terriglobia bacterium]|nr:hypothetical protein [Terriglobia bacterium]